MQTVEQKVVLNQRPVKRREPRHGSIPKELCIKCLDCETYWDLRDTCCDCGSKAGLNVERVLSRDVEVYR